MKRQPNKWRSSLLTIALSSAMVAFTVLAVWVSLSFAYMNGKEAHEKYIYPIVRVTQGSSGGSGTIIYSQLQAIGGKIPTASTYVLTNYHVIEGAISIKEEWDSNLEKEIKEKKEKANK